MTLQAFLRFSLMLVALFFYSDAYCGVKDPSYLEIDKLPFDDGTVVPEK